jgi:hypothetical protein
MSSIKSKAAPALSKVFCSIGAIIMWEACCRTMPRLAASHCMICTRNWRARLFSAYLVAACARVASVEVPAREFQPLMSVSFVAFRSTSSALPIHRTLLHRIKTCPNVPELTPLTNSSVLESWMFMYRSTDTSLPLYSVSPHFNRTTMSLSTLYEISSGL